MGVPCPYSKKGSYEICISSKVHKKVEWNFLIDDFHIFFFSTPDTQ